RSPHKFRTTWPVRPSSPLGLLRPHSRTTQHLHPVEAVENSAACRESSDWRRHGECHDEVSDTSSDAPPDRPRRLARAELALELVQLLADAGVDLALALHLAHRGDHGGVVLVEPGRDLRERAPGELAGEIHRHLTGVRELLGPSVRAELLHG